MGVMECDAKKDTASRGYKSWWDFQYMYRLQLMAEVLGKRRISVMKATWIKTTKFSLVPYKQP